MGDVSHSHEKQIAPEREYNQSLDLCPLEHTLIGSSWIVQDKLINSDTLKREEEVANRLDLLLKPVGLNNGMSTIEEIVGARKKQKIIGGYNPACFDLASYDFEKYCFDYIIGPPDKNNKIPNKFEFKFRRIMNGETSLAEEDLEAFRRLQIVQGYGDLFRLTTNEDTGILILTYIPLKERGK